jgi:hypothetical protein
VCKDCKIKELGCGRYARIYVFVTGSGRGRDGSRRGPRLSKMRSSEVVKLEVEGQGEAALDLCGAAGGEAASAFGP